MIVFLKYTFILMGKSFE